MKKSKNGMIDGVCAGIAEHYSIDPIFVRSIFAVFGDMEQTKLMLKELQSVNPQSLR